MVIELTWQTMISLSVVVLVAFLIPVLLQLRRSAQKVERLADELETQLPDILKNLNQITADLAAMVHSGRNQVEAIGEAVNQAKGLVDNMVHFEKDVKNRHRRSLLQSFKVLSAAVKAVQAFILAFGKRRQ